jgi:hypothetical protein
VTTPASNLFGIQLDWRNKERLYLVCNGIAVAFCSRQKPHGAPEALAVNMRTAT